MECHERYFMIAVDLSVTGEDPHFEAVGESAFCHGEMMYCLSF